MCPEHEILSAFYDGEIPFPWNEQIKRHLASCKECSQKLETYKTIQTRLLQDSEPDFTPSMQRVRNRISLIKHNIRHRKTPFYRKKISLPVPFVTVAAAVLVLIGSLFVFTMMKTGSSSVNIVTYKEDGTRTEVKITAKNVKEIETLLNALEYNSTPNEVIIKLPEGSNEFRVGEPKLIRVMNYKRNGQ
ncbi:MAG: zf-HC2 domain-containing protein [Spirochaetales bacterium]|nr:zf-HC2 domain-containing protein [Spirochaetales bacterium]